MQPVPRPNIRMRVRNHSICLNFCWWICLLLFVVTTASALEVQQVYWGFDNQVVPGRFNLLSVLVANSSAEPFDGTMECYKTRGMEDRLGAIEETPCYLSPLTTRWLQFYVYIDNPYDQWRLVWDRKSDQHLDIDPPKWGPPAQVFLSDPETLLSGQSAFKEFPEELFPPTVAATSGLDSLLMDHAPHWEQAKRQAFLDWLRAGGKVHLLLGADGNYPVFSDELSVLNTPVDRTRIGAGLVIRHASPIRDVRKKDLREEDVPLRDAKSYETPQPNQFPDSFFTILARFSQQPYNWVWIYLLALTYVAALGPGNFLAARKLADYRLRIALLLVTVAGFAALFDIVGRRGQGEANVVHSLSYARVIDGDMYNVTQWINVFATHGAHYTITHAAPHNLYATGQDYETVNGWIANGKDGQFVVDIPMFSRRALLHEGKMKGANVLLKVVKWNGSQTMQQLVVTTDPGFLKQVLNGWMVQGNRIYPMKSVNDRLEFDNASEQPLESFVSSSELQQFANPYYSLENEENTDVEGDFRKLAKPLIGWALSAQDLEKAEVSSAASSHVQLFLFARSPESFDITGPGFGHEVGYVLYHFDLFKPGTDE